MFSRTRSRFGVLSRLSFIAAAAVMCAGNIYAQTAERPVARLVSTNIESARPGRTSEVKNVAVSSSTLSSVEEANSIERRAFEQTNLVRKQNGLEPFVWDSALWRLARTHSENMSRQNFFSHSTPDGMQLKERVRAAGVRYQVIAENIAFNMGYDDPGAFAVERWMVSPKHRANILYAGFTTMAVGTFVAADGSVFLTQMFITR